MESSDGKSSIDTVKPFDASAMPCKIASEIPDQMFKANDFFTNPKNAKSNDRYTHLAVAAARMALKDGGVGDTPETLENPKSIGVMVGTAFGGMETFEQQTLKLAKNPSKPKVRRSKILIELISGKPVNLCMMAKKCEKSIVFIFSSCGNLIL